MWVFCGGMIRSGSTLQYQLAADLVERFGVGRRLPHVPESEFKRTLQDVGHGRGLLVFKAHRCTPDMEELCRSGQGVVLYTFRDFRDVCVSTMKKFGLDFEGLIASGLLEMAVEEGRKWRALPQVLSTRYEDLVLDIPREVVRIATFLRINLPEGMAETIGGEYCLEKQKRRMGEVARRAGEPLTAKDILFDEKSLLHHNHIFGGTMGDWQVELTQKSVEILEEKFGVWLRENDYAVGRPVMPSDARPERGGRRGP